MGPTAFKSTRGPRRGGCPRGGRQLRGRAPTAADGLRRHGREHQLVRRRDCPAVAHLQPLETKNYVPRQRHHPISRAALEDRHRHRACGPPNTGIRPGDHQRLSAARLGASTGSNTIRTARSARARDAQLRQAPAHGTTDLSTRQPGRFFLQIGAATSVASAHFRAQRVDTGTAYAVGPDPFQPAVATPPNQFLGQAEITNGGRTLSSPRRTIRRPPGVCRRPLVVALAARGALDDGGERSPGSGADHSGSIT